MYKISYKNQDSVNEKFRLYCLLINSFEIRIPLSLKHRSRETSVVTFLFLYKFQIKGGLQYNSGQDIL